MENVPLISTNKLKFYLLRHKKQSIETSNYWAYWKEI